jgi:hypothetical protein
MTASRETMKHKTLVLAASLALCCVFDAARAADAHPKPGKAKAADVRTQMGSPTAVRVTDQGEDIWEYAGKRSPYETYFLTFAKNGTLRAVEQVINDKTFSRIK